MRISAALASSLNAGLAGLAGGAAGRLAGTRPMMPPASTPPSAAMCRSFTLIPLWKCAAVTAQPTTRGSSVGYALLAILAQGRSALLRCPLFEIRDQRPQLRVPGIEGEQF